jgi:hypothetical protein
METMQLFKDSVYDALEKRLGEPVGLEGAIRLINEDERLQELLRQYNAKQGIKEFLLWTNGKKKRPASLYLEPAAGKDPAQVYFSYHQYEKDPDFDDGWYAQYALKVAERKNAVGLYLEDNKYRTYSSFRLINVPELKDVTGKDIMSGLEKTIESIASGTCPQGGA